MIDSRIPIAGAVSRRTTDTRHLLPPPQFSLLHAELGVRLARLAETNDALDSARAELSGALAECQEAVARWRLVQTVQGFDDSNAETIRRLQEDRARAAAQSSMLRLHVRRLEAELLEAVRRVEELSDVQQRVAASVT